MTWCTSMGEPRLRTAYDARAMAGEAPYVEGGLPTPEEVQRQLEHDQRQATPASMNLRVRHVEDVSIDSPGDGVIRLACRDRYGAKVTVDLVGLTPGMLLDAVMRQAMR